MFELRRYRTEDGKVPVTQWLASLKNVKTRALIEDRLARVKSGLIGLNTPCRDGVHELKIDHGPGYRIYYARIGKTVLLLLCGGDKGSQDRDIEKAAKYLKDFEWRVKQ
jgi:putative addiction module killer protein